MTIGPFARGSCGPSGSTTLSTTAGHTRTFVTSTFHNVDEVLSDVAGLIDQGFGDSARRLVEYALELLDEASQQVDDSDGGLSNAIGRAEEIHPGRPRSPAAAVTRCGCNRPASEPCGTRLMPSRPSVRSRTRRSVTSSEAPTAKRRSCSPKSERWPSAATAWPSSSLIYLRYARLTAPSAPLREELDRARLP